MTSLVLTASAPRLKSRAIVGTAFAILFALSLAPALLVEIPASVDLPNHLARMSVLSRDGTALAHPHYVVDWALYPNLAMDLIVPRLARFMGLEAAARLFYLAGQILIVSGAVAIEWAVKRRFRIAGFAALLTLHSVPFASGFVNFEFGLGLALWGIAGWIAFRDRSPTVRFAAHVGMTALLFVSHLFALGIYGFTVGVHEAWRAWTRKAVFPETLATFGLLATPVLALLVLMRALGGSVGEGWTIWGLEHKPRWLLYALNGYSVELSATSSGVLALLGYALARRGALAFTGAGPWLAVGFALLFLAMPMRLLDTSYVDARVVAAAALILPAFVSVRLPDPHWRIGASAGVVLVALANIAFVTHAQLSYRAEYRAIIASFDRLDKGARVLVGHSGDAPDPPRDPMEWPIYHAPTLAVHYADAFVPTLFTYPGKQPVSARPALRHLDVPQGGPEPVRVLRAAAVADTPPASPSYFDTWHRDFDYLYVVGPLTPNPMPERLETLATGSRFVLYRIRKPG